jgi:hypothetical protein
MAPSRVDCRAEPSHDGSGLDGLRVVDLVAIRLYIQATEVRTKWARIAKDCNSGGAISGLVRELRRRHSEPSVDTGRVEPISWDGSL